MSVRFNGATPKIEGLLTEIRQQNARAIGLAISMVENGASGAEELLEALEEGVKDSLPGRIAIGITGPPGSGKSTLTDQLIAQYRKQGERLGIVAVDPSSSISGGAILGDRIRMMRHAVDPDVVVRSMATRGRLGGVCAAAGAAVRIMNYSGCKKVIIETVGVGQTEADIAHWADMTILVLAPGLGDDIQAMKAGVIEMADIVVINKADQPGADALAGEMEMIARGQNSLVCQTCALEEKGVQPLIAAISAIQDRNGQNQKGRRRSRQSFEAQVVSCALEMLRPILASQLQAKGSLEGDPRQAAEDLIRAICVKRFLAEKASENQDFPKLD